MVDAIPSFRNRIRTWSFINFFDEEIQLLSLGLETIFLALDELLSSEQLKTIFAIILKIGNLMNDELPSFEARGFTVESLRVLNNIKNVSNKFNLLDFVIHVYESHFEYDRMQFVRELRHVQKAASCMSFNDIRSRSRIVLEGFRSVLSMPRELEEDDLFSGYVEQFIASGKLYIPILFHFKHSFIIYI